MRLKVTIQNAASPALRRLALTGVPAARRRMVDEGMRAALESSRQLNPIKTGRSRAGWSAALRDLNGGRELSGGTGEGQAIRNDTRATTAIDGTNLVSYVPYLEYGTSRTRAVAMVRRSLEVVRRRIAEWFELR